MELPEPPIAGGPFGQALRGAYSELLGREVVKAHAQRLPERIWQVKRGRVLSAHAPPTQATNPGH